MNVRSFIMSNLFQLHYFQSLPKFICELNQQNSFSHYRHVKQVWSTKILVHLQYDQHMQRLQCTASLCAHQSWL